MQTHRYCSIMRAVVLLVFSTLLQAETFKDVEYMYKQDGKEKAERIGGALDFNATLKKVMFESKKVALDIPAASITNVVYERAAKPRYAAGLLLAWPLLFTKSKQHYLTIQYTDDGVGKYAVFKLDKGNFREILAAAEATTGKKVERSEEK